MNLALFPAFLAAGIARFGRILRRLGGIGLLLPLCACAASQAVLPPSTSLSAESLYASLYPFYAEICALGALKKKPGFGAEVSSGIGGHAVFYLNGVCRKPDSAYPVLILCEGTPGKEGVDGVGLSVNAHYANANWVAVEGRNFFFEGGMEPGQPLTREAYAAVLKEAKAKKIYDSVTFHDEVFKDMPPGFSEQDFKYEVSAATDFALAFGRNRYCGRVPMNRTQTIAMIEYLNSLNEPYRSGKASFDWSLTADNCAEMNHNTLAAALIWDLWEGGHSFLTAYFSFPVPKNEFVNLVRRTNDMEIDDLEAVWRDPSARRLLLEEGRLPTGPGAIIDLGRVIPENDVYETESPIIFYEIPIVGRYTEHFDTILTERRYYDLRENLGYFASLYERIRKARQPLDAHLQRIGSDPKERKDFSAFYRRYYAYVDKESVAVQQTKAQLEKTLPERGTLTANAL